MEEPRIMQESQQTTRLNYQPPRALSVGHLQVEQVEQVSLNNQMKLGCKFTETLRSR